MAVHSGCCFIKQKTAYEIKECDWSSDVCSSDLSPGVERAADAVDVRAAAERVDGAREKLGRHDRMAIDTRDHLAPSRREADVHRMGRVASGIVEEPDARVRGGPFHHPPTGAVVARPVDDQDLDALARIVLGSEGGETRPD